MEKFKKYNITFYHPKITCITFPSVKKIKYCNYNQSLSSTSPKATTITSLLYIFPLHFFFFPYIYESTNILPCYFIDLYLNKWNHSVYIIPHLAFFQSILCFLIFSYVFFFFFLKLFITYPLG